MKEMTTAGLAGVRGVRQDKTWMWQGQSAFHSW
jgi:hypothetical protein